MASQQQGKNVDAAVVVDGVGESSTGESSPDRVLPLDALKSLMPECKDDHQDITACAWDTINDCITEATVRLAFVSANNATAQGKRKVITAEDVTRAIEGLNEKDAGPGMVILEMSAVVAEKRAAAMRRRQQRRLRQEQATKQRAKKEEEAAAAAAALEEGPPAPVCNTRTCMQGRRCL